MRSVPQRELRFRSSQGPAPTLVGVVRQAWLAGLGALVGAEEAGRIAFAELVSKGQAVQAHRRPDTARHQVGAGRRLAGLREALEALPARPGSALLNRLGLPGRDDVTALARQINGLQGMLDNLAEEA